MRVYQFTEQPYPDVWNDHNGSLRVNLPNRKLDPRHAADLFHRYYDEWQLADELGLDIMLNEHHATATCMSATVVVGLSVLARITKKARLLVLGYPIANRPDPLRAAEELATIDVISRGRLDMGFVRGVPQEVPIANMNPVFQSDRFWEAHDFIMKALTSHDEPFNWESENFNYRHVNVWPRCYQQPHPPVWSTTGSTQTAKKLGGYGYVMATLGTGYATRRLFDAYRQGYAEKRNGAMPGADRFAYLALVAVGRTEEDARRRGELIATYPRSSGIVFPPFRNPPGYLSIEDNVRILKGEGKPRSYTKDGAIVDMGKGSVQDLIDAGVMFCGTPDQVHDQIVDFVDHCGGMGNLLMMGHAGPMSHEDTVENLSLFAQEVYPRLKAFKQPDPVAVAAQYMRGIESKFVTVEGMRTHYLEGGKGFPVVLLHSGEFGGCAELSWEFNLPALAEHFHVIAPDWLGFGESAKLFSFDDMRGLRVRHIALFLKALGVGPAHFIGNSMGGGMLAAVAASGAPAWDIDKIILVGAGGFAPVNEARTILNTYDGTREHMRRVLQTVLTYSPLRFDEAYLEKRHRLSLVPGSWECTAAARFRRPGVKGGERDETRYGDIKRPTLIVAGGKDPLREPGFGPKLQAEIAGSELAVFDEAGHFPHIDMPERFNTAAIDFLSR